MNSIFFSIFLIYSFLDKISAFPQDFQFPNYDDALPSISDVTKQFSFFDYGASFYEADIDQLESTTSTRTATQSTETPSTIEVDEIRDANLQTRPTTVANLQTRPTTVANLQTRPTTVANLQTRPTTVANLQTNPTTVANLKNDTVQNVWTGFQPIFDSKIVSDRKSEQNQLLFGDLGESECLTKNLDPCQIPYVYNGVLYFECTTLSPASVGKQGMCPTKLANTTTREASNQIEDWELCSKSCPLQKYTPNLEINSILTKLATENPDFVKLIRVGKSALGQEILGVAISKNVEERAILRPMVRYVGNMHGNEAVGRELLIHLATMLVHSYNHQDYRIRQLIDSTNVTIIPTMNPDGFDRSTEGKCTGGDYVTGRYNEGDVDLNRDFPTWKDVGKSYDEYITDRQPESKALIDLILAEPWVLSANFHGGAVVASYPYDDYRGKVQKGVHATPDHDFFKHLASLYADNHLSMKNQSHCTRWYFKDGITNGAEWYPLVGGMQDYNYIFSNGMEITLEVSCCKYPKSYYLNHLWDENKESMLKYLEEVHKGVKGIVEDINGKPIKNAQILVENVDSGTVYKSLSSSSAGEYWKLLLPGNYRLKAEMASCSLDGTQQSSPWFQVSVTEEIQLVEQNLTLTDSACPR